ncbi:MAG: hypothetical protein WED15_03640 [Akkermansiaceae bacterium]
MKLLLDQLRHLLAAFIPIQLEWCGHPAPPAREELLWANTGGPRSRVVSTPIVSQLLSKGSAALGFIRLDHYQMLPRFSGEGFREIARRLLLKAGFGSPEQAWDALRDQLPEQAALAVEVPPDSAPDVPGENEHASLIAALVLGKCCGSLFSPSRPIIWSERRLARSLRLVHCDSESFTRQDDE